MAAPTLLFEVFIPSDAVDGFDVSLRVEARNWMQALKLGLLRTYSDTSPVRNVFCDIKDDDLIHVTDLVSRRVFKIRRLEGRVLRPLESSDAPVVMGMPTLLDATAVAPSRYRHPREFPAVDARRELTPREDEIPTLKTGLPLGYTDEQGRFRAIMRRRFDVEAAETGSGPVRVVDESVMPTSPHIPAMAIGRDIDAEERSAIAENTLERVFLESSELFAGAQTLEAAVQRALDMAMRSVPAESGSVLFADDAGSSLYFAAARGPKAEELLARDFSVPIDVGIVGFCMRAGVSLAVSDAAQDPRFYSAIAEELGYPTRSVLCAPVEHEGRAFGALELLNRKDGEAFAGAQLNVLTFLAGQLGRYIDELVA